MAKGRGFERFGFPALRRHNCGDLQLTRICFVTLKLSNLPCNVCAVHTKRTKHPWFHDYRAILHGVILDLFNYIISKMCEQWKYPPPHRMDGADFGCAPSLHGGSRLRKLC